jgi:hypothetical protein
LKPELPDSIFPNNWFSSHRSEDIPGKSEAYLFILKFYFVNTFYTIDGLLVVYPMRTPSREAEKNPKLIAELEKTHKNKIDLAPLEKGSALEGTGSLLYDVVNKKIYCQLY